MYFLQKNNVIYSYKMSYEPMTSANFYERDDVTYEFFEDNDHVIQITSPSNDISQLFIQDFSPLCFTIFYEDGEVDPSMSQEELHDIHYQAKKGLDYNKKYVLNHHWVDKIKTMINWQPGTEVGIQATCDDGNMYIIIYDDVSSCSTKIDEDGYLCFTMKIPTSRTHLHDTIFHTSPSMFTEYQRVVCWYNIALEEDSHYILK